MAVTKINIAHSPDADDAFMFYALSKEKVTVEGLQFEHTLADIETLNQNASKAVFDITALSAHSYVYCCDKYDILSVGASVGRGYGPTLVGRQPYTLTEVRDLVVAIPGEKTTGFLALRLVDPYVKYVTVPFDKVIPAVLAGDADLGLVIHEGQMTYKEHKLTKILDLGEWWQNETSCPLVLGLLGIKKSIPDSTKRKVAGAIRESVKYAMKNRDEAIEYAKHYWRARQGKVIFDFVSRYVNEDTIELPDDCIESLSTMYKSAAGSKLIPSIPKIKIIRP